MDYEGSARPNPTDDVAGVGIEQEFVMIGEDACLRVPASMEPKAVSDPGLEHVGEGGVDLTVPARKHQAPFLTSLEEAQLHRLGVGAVDGDVIPAGNGGDSGGM
jgi:hypothetical protein